MKGGIFMPTSEIRKEAREALKGNWKKAILITLAFMAISFAIGFFQGLVGEGTLLYNIINTKGANYDIVLHGFIFVFFFVGTTLSFVLDPRGVM
jgi:uncharacterized membrane protein